MLVVSFLFCSLSMSIFLSVTGDAVVCLYSSVSSLIGSYFPSKINNKKTLLASKFPNSVFFHTPLSSREQRQQVTSQKQEENSVNPRHQMFWELRFVHFGHLEANPWCGQNSSVNMLIDDAAAQWKQVNPDLWRSKEGLPRANRTQQIFVGKKSIGNNFALCSPKSNDIKRTFFTPSFLRWLFPWMRRVTFITLDCFHCQLPFCLGYIRVYIGYILLRHLTLLHKIIIPKSMHDLENVKLDNIKNHISCIHELESSKAIWCWKGLRGFVVTFWKVVADLIQDKNRSDEEREASIFLVAGATLLVTLRCRLSLHSRTSHTQDGLSWKSSSRVICFENSTHSQILQHVNQNDCQRFKKAHLAAFG